MQGQVAACRGGSIALPISPAARMASATGYPAASTLCPRALVPAGPRGSMRCVCPRPATRRQSASHFPDPVSRLVDAERRAQFLREGSHYEGEYAIVVQFTPPLRRKSKLADLIYDDDPAKTVSPASRILEHPLKALGDLEDAVGDAVSLRRMERSIFSDRVGRDHLRDHLVNYLHFALTGEEVALNVPPAGAYLDAVIGGRELWLGDTPAGQRA